MYLYSKTSARAKNRKRSTRYRAKLKSKNRRRVNRMAGTSQGRRLFKRK